MKRKPLNITGSLSGGGMVLVAVVLVCFVWGCCQCAVPRQEPVSTKSTKSTKTKTGPRLQEPLVVSRHALAREAGYRILEAGGNAFDAFVAVTAVENVVSSGYVTFAGLLSVLLYHGKSGQTMYLDAGFNSVLDPAGVYDSSDTGDGKKIVVPGVVAGLEVLSKKYGRLNFTQAIQPALEIAENGFVIDETFAGYLEADAAKIQRTEYGRKTFFPGGKLLRAGDILKQPELAHTLANLAKQGAAYMYTGEWASRCVETVRNEGGLMTLQDLASYRPTWCQPWTMSYRGYEIHASSGRCMYGLLVLLALKTLEHTNLKALGHFSVSAEALETLVRVVEAVSSEKWLKNVELLDNRESVNSRLTPAYTEGIWEKVRQGLEKESRRAEPPGSCTLSSIVADKEGNVVSGKHSINSDLWGNGLFVGGVLLNGSGDMRGRDLGPGRRRTQGAPNFLVFKDGTLRVAGGTFSLSNPQAALQFLVNLLEYGLPVRQAVELPRFGSYPYDIKTGDVDLTKIDLDERFSRDMVTTLEKRGLRFNQANPQLGKGCFAEFLPDGTVSTGTIWEY